MKMKKQHQIKSSALILPLAFCLTSTPLSAAVTYVGATLLNTDNAAGGADSTWADGDDGTTGGTAADGTGGTADSLWKYRSGFGVGGIWEARGPGAPSEDGVRLKTTIAVTNGTYNVYAFFVAVTAGSEGNPAGGGVDNDMPIRAGNTSGSLELFDQLGSGSFSTYTGYVAGTAGKNALSGGDALTFASTPTRTDGTRDLLYGLLSTTQVVTDGMLEVFIDDLPGGLAGSSDARTWYDGVGYEAVPEPSSTALLSLGGLALILRRRK